MDEWDQTWRRLRAGDASAYGFLLERLGPGVWGYLRRMSGRDEVADELFGRTWLRVVQTAGRIRSPRAIRQYVLSIARRQWLDELGRRQRDVLNGAADGIVADEGAIDDLPAASTSALEALACREDTDRVRQAIDALPAPLREVVVLRTYGGLTFSQIAELSDLPLGTVLTRMRSATHRLAERLKR